MVAIKLSITVGLVSIKTFKISITEKQNITNTFIILDYNNSYVIKIVL